MLPGKHRLHQQRLQSGRSLLCREQALNHHSCPAMGAIAASATMFKASDMLRAMLHGHCSVLPHCASVVAHHIQEPNKSQKHWRGRGSR